MSPRHHLVGLGRERAMREEKIMRRRSGSAYSSRLGSGSGTRNRPIAPGESGPCCQDSPMFLLVCCPLLGPAGTSQYDAVMAAPVLPDCVDLEAEVPQERSNGSIREPVTVLGVDRFTSRGMEVQFRRSDRYVLFTCAFKVHLG